MKLILLLLTIHIGSFFTGYDDATLSYIDTYAPMAVEEMKRSGIPASIILAQGIHESNSGQSDLAVEARNHFGIKCKSYWKGATYYHKDDDYENGRLIPSCFRAYDQVQESYKDHTDFLMNTSYYQNLFAYSKHDYAEWAHGLKNCGYATDPRYAEKLIFLINTYSLDRFDRMKELKRKKTGTVLEGIEDRRIELPDNYRRQRYMDK
jgi:flagellum-specific peptidoglycan hydrolase FlgJ